MKTLRNVTEYNGDTLNLNFTDYYNIYRNSEVLKSHDRFGTHFIDSVYLDTVLIKTIFLN